MSDAPTEHTPAYYAGKKTRAVNVSWRTEFLIREILTEYSEWLMDHGYLDTDWWKEVAQDEGEGMTTVDLFLRDSK